MLIISDYPSGVYSVQTKFLLFLVQPQKIQGNYFQLQLCSSPQKVHRTEQGLFSAYDNVGCVIPYFQLMVFLHRMYYLNVFKFKKCCVTLT